MPWYERSPMDQRMQFVTEFDSGLFTMTELAEHYGISRTTGYKWVERHDAEGVLGLADRSRRPHHSPQATDSRLIEALVALRKRHPRWGAKKLLGILTRRRPDADWPARSTVCDRLKAAGLVAARRRVPRPGVPVPQPRAAITTANEVWTTDFKGEFRTGDTRYCYPFTLRDGYSRFVLRCDALLCHTEGVTRPCFERAFTAYGLPERIRSDNGPPCASVGLGRLSRLAVWWIRLGIVPERIDPGHPEQNGSHEQFHRVLKADTARPPADNAAAQQHRFRRFCAEYNPTRSVGRRRAGDALSPLAAAPAESTATPRVSRSRGNPPRLDDGRRIVASHAVCVRGLGGRTHRLRRSRRWHLDRQVCHGRPGSLRRASTPDSTHCPVHCGALAGFAGSRLNEKDDEKNLNNC